MDTRNRAAQPWFFHDSIVGSDAGSAAAPSELEYEALLRCWLFCFKALFRHDPNTASPYIARIFLMPEEGQTLGPYRIQTRLGAGSMGEVYRALDTRMGRQVALKILPESLAHDEDRRRRFEQEARLAAALNHPNIMAIYDVGLDRHPPYIVAELVPGESLRALIGKAPLPVRKVVDIAAQIASGLAAAHAAGIVHRDLKPENAIVTPDGTVKVLDFGVARMQPKPRAGNETMTIAQTLAGSVVGTAAYMSPEQARAEEVDHRSDQFSLGLVLYELLSGKQAFVRPSAIQTMSAIVEDDPPPLDRPVPPQLRWILERCLAKEREGRYESTRDLARELTYLRDHFGDTTSTATAALPAVKSHRRAGPIALAACALAGAVLAWCAAQLMRNPAAIDLSSYRLTPFATALSQESYAAWSPDGKNIAFLGTTADDELHLFVQGVGAPTPVQLTGAGSRIHGGSPPFWSPDSQSVYFRCTIKDATGICRIPVGGGEPFMVQPNLHAAAISPDGKTLAMWPSRPEGGNVAVWIASPPEAMPRKYQGMPFHSSQFYNNPTLAFSPDGKSILLCVALDTRGETAWLLPWPEGPGKRAFAGGLPFSYTPQFSWMPDSRHVLFADSTFAQHSQLYIAEVSSGRHWPVLKEDRPMSLPTLSPDGSRAAYTSGLSHSDIVGVPLGEGPVEVLLSSSRSEVRVNASPVAPRIVYVTDRRGVNEVWMKNMADGTERPLLTPNDIQIDGGPAHSFMNPVFSSDGRRIAVAAIGQTGIHLYTMFVSGGAPVRATSTSDLEFCATWSPDGNWLAYSAVVGPSPQLMKVRPGTGEPPVKVSETYGAAAPVWSPDGASIADHDREGNVVLLSPDGKLQRTLSRDEGPMAWSHDSKTLYQVRRQPISLVAIDVATGKQRKLRDLPGLDPFSNGNPGLSAALSWDEKSIVYTVNRPRTEIWILDGIPAPQPWYRRIFSR